MPAELGVGCGEECDHWAGSEVTYDFWIRHGPSADQYRVGDVIVSLGVRPVRSSGALAQAVPTHRAGQAVTVGYLRGGARHAARVTLALTHEEIAQLIGASRETVTRTLSEFKRQRTIELHGATLILKNRLALESLVAA